jgi:eukaryotic-like serine/threonine-protein kinase
VAADGSDEIITKKICVACQTEFSQGELTCPNDGTALTTIKQDSLIGSLLGGGRYQIEEKIGSGAMGEVYKAKHCLMKRQVAIKMMHPQTISGANALKRFQKEAEMASALNHPNILAVHDFGVSEEGSPYLVMNYLEGRSLTDEIPDNGHLDVPRALHIFRQLCQGLGHAHEKGVIHRDLKPSNIMLVTLDQDTDFVQILDFGIAKQLSPEGSSDSLTRTGEVFGSPHYMSPEQCRAKPVDARSDIYALGCVMYRVLTGYPPLMGGDLVECLYKHVNEMPVPFSQICPEYNLPDDLEAVIFKAVAKKPEDRYQSMAELKLALESVEAYKLEIATKTYGSLAGIKASATLTSLPASTSISYGGQSGDMSTATSTSTAATTVSASTIAAAVGPLAKPKATQTGDLPAQTPVISDHSEEGGESSAARTSPSSSEPSSDSGDGSTGPSFPPAGHQALNAGTGASGTAGRLTTAISALTKGGPVSKKIMIGVAVPVGLLVIVGAVALLSPSGNAKIEKLQKEAQSSYEQGKYDLAEQKIRSAINEEKSKSLPENETSPYLLGKIQYAEGDYPNAENSLESALKLTQGIHGANSREAAEVQASLGRNLTLLGQYSRAEQMLQQAYQTRKKLSGDNSSLVADSLAGLGYLHVREHSYQKAISELTNALKIVQANSGADSPEAATALCTLAEAYQWSGNWPQAEALYKQALTIRKKKLDANNLRIADSLEGLASVYLGEGSLMQAKACYEQALVIESKSLDSASPRLAQTRQQLASINSRLAGRRHR